jgi:hypothetical protein
LGQTCAATRTARAVARASKTDKQICYRAMERVSPDRRTNEARDRRRPNVAVGSSPGAAARWLFADKKKKKKKKECQPR